MGSELAWCKDSVLRVITENTSCRRYILRRFIDLHSRHCSLVSMTGQIPYLIRSALKFNGGCMMGVRILTSLLFNIKLLDLALDKRIHAHVRQEIYQGTWHISQISFGLNHGDVQKTDYCARTLC